MTVPGCYYSLMKKHGKVSPPACTRRSACPIANTLDLIGDKWTLLVVRDLFFLGERQYGEMMQASEGIPSSVLADRLKRLEDAGLLEKKPYQQNPVRYTYRLTSKGTDLFPILKEMIRWGNRHIPGTTMPPKGFLESFENSDALARTKLKRR